MKFREHRGSFHAAMKTTKEFYSIDDLKKHLNSINNKSEDSIIELVFDYAKFDDRNGWDTYYVLQRFCDETEFTVAGMSDGEL